MTDLTISQQAFVDELVASGCTPTEAARRVGYSHPGQEAYRLMRNQRVMRAVKELQNRLIAGPGCNVARKTLLEVMGDKKAPASARVSAARTMLDAGGYLSGKAENDDEKPMSEMGYDELAAVVQRANDVIAGRVASMTGELPANSALAHSH